MKAFMMVTFKVEADKEENFNYWYDGYIPRIMAAVPELSNATRYVSKNEDGNYYASIYEISGPDEFEAAKLHLASPMREKDVADWHIWEEHYLSNITFGYYEAMSPTKERTDFGL